MCIHLFLAETMYHLKKYLNSQSWMSHNLCWSLQIFACFVFYKDHNILWVCWGGSRCDRWRKIGWYSSGFNLTNLKNYSGLFCVGHGLSEVSIEQGWRRRKINRRRLLPLYCSFLHQPFYIFLFTFLSPISFVGSI